MAEIKAEGVTIFGKQSITVSGGRDVAEIQSGDKAFAAYVRGMIRDGTGIMANAYKPPPKTMLQAYAVLSGLFKASDIAVTGDIGTMPYQSGVIY